MMLRSEIAKCSQPRFSNLGLLSRHQYSCMGSLLDPLNAQLNQMDVTPSTVKAGYTGMKNHALCVRYIEISGISKWCHVQDEVLAALFSVIYDQIAAVSSSLDSLESQ